ncbi:GFA family protein [Dyella acidiphila]|uniref:GFA family protein n=1 Tax=Dyella acidiphila TaxID=2775866 RepID=A0ABR9G802_9GAMM|nr:GFA family protein [Dyella acidiphila]MBE1160156.1 GFA family protein [Dyella acidiphila]
MQQDAPLQTFAGSCHCGSVQFRVQAAVTELTTCDCSLCRMRNALMLKVPESALTLLQGEEALALYQWNTRRARHYFCRHCGIYVFHNKRAAPDHFGVNVFCLENFDPSTVPVRATEGAGMTVEDAAARAQWPGPRRI